MNERTLGGLLDRRVARDEEDGEPGDALRAAGNPERRYTAARLRTDGRKTGNFLRQLGVGPGRTVAIADLPVPESVLTLFGAALLGAPIRFVSADASEAESSSTEAIEARVSVGPVGAMSDLPVDAAKRIAYRGAPDDPEIAYFERDVWSENPTFPPGGPGETAVAIETREKGYTHGEVVRATKRVVETRSLDTGTEIAVRAPLADPRTIVAGVLAALSGGGVIVLPGGETQGDVAVVAGETGSVPEPRTIDVGDVALDDR